MDSTAPSRTRSQVLGPLLRREELYDIWRIHHLQEQDFSFFSNAHNTYSRIDLFVLGRSLLQLASYSTIETIKWSDHAAISLSIEETYNVRDFVALQ